MEEQQLDQLEGTIEDIIFETATAAMWCLNCRAAAP